jgi:hypothetical protein
MGRMKIRKMFNFNKKQIIKSIYNKFDQGPYNVCPNTILQTGLEFKTIISNVKIFNFTSAESLLRTESFSIN